MHTAGIQRLTPEIVALLAILLIVAIGPRPALDVPSDTPALTGPGVIGAPVDLLELRTSGSTLQGSEPAGVPRRLSPKALSLIAGRTALQVAQLGAIGATTEEVDAEARTLAGRTGCDVVPRVMVVPSGFTDQIAIRHRIEIEASYYGAVVTESAEWLTEPDAGLGREFGRVIGTVFLSGCPRTPH